MTTYRLGRLGFELLGDHAVAAHLREEFAPIEVHPAEPLLRFAFTDALGHAAGATHVGPLRVWPDAFTAEQGGLAYHVDRSGPVTDVRIRPASLPFHRRFTPASWLRARDWNYLTPHEVVAKNFVYGIFDYLSQIVQLPLGQSWLHASSFERDGRAVAVIGWGGIGKTTAMLKLATEDGWRFLSDDLVAIDADGVLWRNPKRLQVYAYNVRGQPLLRKALLRDRSPLDRLTWAARARIFGPKHVRRRVSAEWLLGEDAVSARAQLEHALYFERSDVPDFRVRPLTVDELAHRAALTLLHELQPFTELSLAMQTTGVRPSLPSTRAMYEDSRRVLAQAFARVHPQLVEVPVDAGPDDVSAFMRGLLDGRAGTRP